MIDVFNISLADIDAALSPAKMRSLVSDLSVALCGLLAVPRQVELKSDGVCRLVFSLTDGTNCRYFKKEGSTGWNVTAWDGALTEVYPETKTITVFEPKKAG